MKLKINDDKSKVLGIREDQRGNIKVKLNGEGIWGSDDNRKGVEEVIHFAGYRSEGNFSKR